jgi:Sec-independent protein secretion pathway component TatC
MLMQKHRNNMSKFTPTIYFCSVLAVFVFAWYFGPEDRLVNLAWALPGMLIGTFTVLWNATAKLQRKIAKLEGEIETLKRAQSK